MLNQFPLVFVVSKIPVSYNLYLLDPIQLKSGTAQSQTQFSFFKLDLVQVQAEPPRVSYMESGGWEKNQTSRPQQMGTVGWGLHIKGELGTAPTVPTWVLGQTRGLGFLIR